MVRVVKLGVNIDHVATLRNARGGAVPSVLRAAQLVKESGGHGLTVHLREDRRHIRDEDVYGIRELVDLPMNLEIAATEEMLSIALEVKPNSCCLVPEKREELTTEGGLDAASNISYLTEFSARLRESNIKTSLFLDPDRKQIDAAKQIGAEIIEFHTGSYCNYTGEAREAELGRIREACEYAGSLGIICHAGHGLDYDTVPDIVKIPQVEELNIGHFIIGESVFEGLPSVISKMNKVISSNL